MILGWLLLIATLGSSIWVFFDAPRHGLSRAWSVGCVVFWVAFFPWYLIERDQSQRSPPDSAATGHGRRDLARRLSHPRIVGHRKVAALALGVALLLTVFGVWQLRLVLRGPYMLFLVRHPALTSIPLLAGATAFLVHLLFKLGKRVLQRRARQEDPARAAPPLAQAQGAGGCRRRAGPRAAERCTAV